MSGSLDGHLKIYDLKTYELAHGFKYKSGVLAFGMSPSNSHLFAGTVDGILAVRRRTVKRAEQTDAKNRQAIIRGGSYKYFLRGRTHSRLLRIHRGHHTSQAYSAVRPRAAEV